MYNISRLNEKGKEMKSQKILIVDDSETNLLLSSKSLGKPGYKILKATDGMQALNMVSEENPHLIILDMQMPVMDGISFLKLFRKRNLSIPILALSAMPEETIYSEALRLGVVDFLKKPFELSFLLYKVKKVLGKSTN